MIRCAGRTRQRLVMEFVCVLRTTLMVPWVTTLNGRSTAASVGHRHRVGHMPLKLMIDRLVGRDRLCRWVV